MRHNYWVHTPQSPVLCSKRSPCSPELEKTHIQRRRPKIAQNKYIYIYIYVYKNGGWTSHVPHHPSPPQPFQVSRKGTQWFCVNSWSYKMASWLTVPDLHPSSTAVPAPSCFSLQPQDPSKTALGHNLRGQQSCAVLGAGDPLAEKRILKLERNQLLFFQLVL